jgi:hypothetical protein
LARRPTGRLLGWSTLDVQIKLSWQPAMIKAFQRWLDASGLFAITTGILGGILLISIVLVFGGYLIVLALS